MHKKELVIMHKGFFLDVEPWSNYQHNKPCY